MIETMDLLQGSFENALQCSQFDQAWQIMMFKHALPVLLKPRKVPDSTNRMQDVGGSLDFQRDFNKLKSLYYEESNPWGWAITKLRLERTSYRDWANVALVTQVLAWCQATYANEEGIHVPTVILESKDLPWTKDAWSEAAFGGFLFDEISRVASIHAHPSSIQDLEEVVSRTFYSLLRAIKKGSFDEREGSARGFIHGVVRHVTADVWREKSKNTTTMPLPLFDEFRNTHADPEAILLATEIKEQVIDAVAKTVTVFSDNRNVDTLLKALAHQGTYKELARVQGIKPETIRQRIARARDILSTNVAQQLEEQGIPMHRVSLRNLTNLMTMSSSQALEIFMQKVHIDQTFNVSMSRSLLNTDKIDLIYGKLNVAVRTLEGPAGFQSPYWLFVVDRFPGANLSHPHDFYLLSAFTNVLLKVPDVGYPPDSRSVPQIRVEIAK